VCQHTSYQFKLFTRDTTATTLPPFLWWTSSMQWQTTACFSGTSDSQLLAHFNSNYHRLPPGAYSTTKARDAILHDLCAAQEDSSRATSNINAWKVWTKFWQGLALDLWLSDNMDPILLLQVFAKYYRIVELAPPHHPVQSCTIEGALCAVSQTFLCKCGAQYP
jgi:hypothetical protein